MPFSTVCTIPSLSTAATLQYRALIDCISSNNNSPQTFRTAASLIHISYTLERRMVSHTTAANWSLSGMLRQQFRHFSVLVIDLWCFSWFHNVLNGHTSTGVVPLISSDYVGRQAKEVPRRKISGKHGNCIFIVYCIILHLRDGGLGVCLIVFGYKYYMNIQN